MRSTVMALFVLFSSAKAADEDPCTILFRQVGAVCKAGDADVALAKKVGGQCKDYSAKLKQFDARLEALAKQCSKTGATASKAGGKSARGDQSLAQKDTAALLAQNQQLMQYCADEMNNVRDNFLGLSKEVQGYYDELPAAKATEPCTAKVTEVYKIFKTRADERASKAAGLAGQYQKGSDAAKDLARRGNGKGDNMNGDNKSAGGGGGGAPQMPQMPQMPQQKKDQSKTPAQLAAEEKARRQAECAGLIKSYQLGIQTCNIEHHCQPEIARVPDVCDAYNTCITKEVAPVPSDCAGAPTLATPK